MGVIGPSVAWILEGGVNWPPPTHGQNLLSERAVRIETSLVWSKEPLVINLEETQFTMRVKNAWQLLK